MDALSFRKDKELILHISPQSLSYLPHFIDPAVVHDNNKFLSALARNMISRMKGISEYICQLGKYDIPGRMSIRIVHPLEMIDIHDEQREHSRFTVTRLHLGFEESFKCPGIMQACKEIPMRGFLHHMEQIIRPFQIPQHVIGEHARKGE
ncbi:hypothetical protein D3C85_1332320 [compost metagenome]